MPGITLERLRCLSPRNFDDVVLSPEEVLGWFPPCRASWLYDGEPDPAKPHAELTSGKCSDGYFDCPRVLQHPNLAEILGIQLAKKLAEALKLAGLKVGRVVGSPYAAVTISHEVAKALRTPHGFCTKDPRDPTGKRFLWDRLMLPKGTHILQVEELITTRKTTMEIRRAVREGNSGEVIFLPLVGALVHRPPRLPLQYTEFQVVALIEKEVHAWEPEDCPFCAVGSKPLPPKTHWEELTGQG